jgi:hypothetical protein
MFSVFVPVGPGPDELDRLADTLDSLRAHAPAGELSVILIDDSPTPRELDRSWPGATVLRTPLWGRGKPDAYSAMTAGTIEALKRSRGDFALKLDTDALVIAPFADGIKAILARDRSVGVIGAYDLAAAGGQRDFSMWRPLIRRSTWPLRVVRASGGMPRVSLVAPRERRAAADLIRAAAGNPAYTLGAHCLGGAYAVAPSLLAHRDLLDWRPWVHTHLSEDVVLGLLCGAAGLRMQSAVEAFAVSWKGLPAAPAELLERGHSIVHSVKDGPHGTERELREWFRANAR